MRTSGNNNIGARVSSLETAVESLTSDIRSIAASVDALRETISQSRQPQWGNLIAAVGLSVVIIGAVGASYVAPITVRLAAHGDTLAERGVVIDGIQHRLRAAESEIDSTSKVREAQIAALNARIEDIAAHGSGITRERLAVIEAELGRKGP